MSSTGFNAQGSPGPSPGKQRSPGVILIPIGLIITLIITVLRMMAGAPQRNTYSESDTNSLNMGVYYYNAGDYDMALIHFNLAIASEPDMGEAYNGRGLVYYALGENEKALADLDRAIQLMPDAAYAYSNRGAVYLSTGNHDRAIEDLDKAIEFDPRLAKAYQNRGLTHMDLGNLEQAIADFSQAIELTPEFIFAMQSTMESRSTPGARSLSQDIQTDLMNTQTYADLPRTYASRAIAYLQKGDLERASADVKKARELGLDPEVAEQIEALLGVAAFETLPETAPVEPLPGIAPSGPPTGHWQGTSDQGTYQQVVSFDVGMDGNIYNFGLHLYFGMHRDCWISADEILVNTDKTFSLMSGTPGAGGASVVQGAFADDMSVAGQSGQSLECLGAGGQPVQLSLPEGVSWSASWVGPLETP